MGKQEKPKKVTARIYRITENGKWIEIQTNSENKLTNVVEQQKRLQEKLNPLKGTFEQINKIAQQQKAWQEKLNPLGNVINKFQNPAFQIIEQQKILQEKLNPLKGTFEQINKIAQQQRVWQENLTPIFEYATKLQSIIIRYSTPEIIETHNNIALWIKDFEKEKAEAEANYYHNITVQELEQEIRYSESEREKEKQAKAELEEYVKELESALKTVCKVNSSKQTIKQLTETLHPNITPSQIVKLYETLKDVFIATLEQWECLFAKDRIQLTQPIRANTIADVAVLLHHLRQKELIETTKYPSILEKVKAFSFNGDILTAKQIKKPKESYNFPYTGKNYTKISEVITNL